MYTYKSMSREQKQANRQDKVVLVRCMIENKVQKLVLFPFCMRVNQFFLNGKMLCN